MTAYEIAAAVNVVARAWQANGRLAPEAASRASATLCEMPGCEGMSFVQLKTSMGLTTLCFAHFESVKADLRS